MQVVYAAQASSHGMQTSQQKHMGSPRCAAHCFVTFGTQHQSIVDAITLLLLCCGPGVAQAPLHS
jgi:hypothetical protein